MPKSSKEKQDQRKAELQAAALRDGFENWSQALTAWKNGEARLTMRGSDGANVCRVTKHFYVDGVCAECGYPKPPRRTR